MSERLLLVIKAYSTFSFVAMKLSDFVPPQWNGSYPWGLVGEWVIPQVFDRGMGHILRGLIGVGS